MKPYVSEIRKWFVRGKESGARYLLVVDSKFRGNHYPYYLGRTESLSKALKRINRREEVIETYDLWLDVEEQISQHRPYG